MAKTIIIGKEGNQARPITDQYVSRKHATLTIDDSKKMHLKDNNSVNGTFIRLKDGSFKRIEEMDVTPGMTLRFGPDFECKVKDLIPEVKEPEFDITPLKYMEMNYNSEKVAFEQRISTLNTLRMMVMVAGSAITGIVGFIVKDESLKFIIAAIPLLVAAIGYFILIRMNSKVIRRRNDCDTNFKRNYSCPKCCMSFYGKMYNNIRVAGKCPNCNAKYKGEL